VGAPLEEAWDASLVLLTYVDESYTKERYFLAALLVPDSEANSLTAALSGVVMDAAMDHGSLRSSAELHGYDIVSAKGDWARLATKIRVRIGVYNKAMQAIADHDVKVIVRSVDIVGLQDRYPHPDHPHSVTLNHLIERVDEYAASVQELTIMIADEVDGQDEYRRDLWQYQQSGTRGYRKRQITRVVDTIHFAPSSSSRLVQAADLIAYMANRIATLATTDPRARKANETIWARIEPRVWHNGCWWPTG
jgi:Protein of unknown function (DUF3800)